MAESIWKWFLRLMLTVVLFLIISILGLIAVNVPSVFDSVDSFTESTDKAARSVIKTSERAYDALEDIEEQSALEDDPPQSSRRVPVFEPQTPIADACTQSISRRSAIIGSWDSDCNSASNSGSYARYYTFSLSARSNVITITLESDDADTYLYLLEGKGRNGEILHSNDDYDNTNSQITTALDPGDYTIEATTYTSQATGDFTLTVSGIR